MNRRSSPLPPASDPRGRRGAAELGPRAGQSREPLPARGADNRSSREARADRADRHREPVPGLPGDQPAGRQSRRDASASTRYSPARPASPDTSRRGGEQTRETSDFAANVGRSARWVARQLQTPQTNYKAIMLITLALVGLGLVMVLSSSMVVSRSTQNSVWTEFLKQAAMVGIGLVGFWVALRLRAATIRRAAPLLLLVAIALLLLLFGAGVGEEEVGNNSWLRYGAIGVQPSEVAKLALAVWGSVWVAKNARSSADIRQVLGLFIAASAVVVGLVLLQKDLGMMFTVGIVVFAVIFFAGVSSRALAVAGAIMGVLLVGAIATQSFRSNRISTWIDALFLSFDSASVKGSSYQTYQGILSLSDGGLTGAGLGQSRAKWFYLPEAKNDFIFAIIGEELGWIGAIGVVVLFALLAWFGIRTALAQADPFRRLLAATLTVGVVVQAFYNMGYVMGMLPVTGIQLPMISAGGTSAVITLFSMGLLANCARHEPEAISSMQHEGRPWFDRVLRVPEPLPYAQSVQSAQRRIERRTTPQRYGEPVTRRPPTPGSGGRDALRERERTRVRDVGPSYDGRRRTELPPPALPPNRPRRHQ